MTKYKIFVIGAGGTGTYFLKEFSRYLSGNKEMKDKIDSMEIFDGDYVEHKNLARQCFTEDDIGRNKAAVMAEVLNETFDLNYVAHDSYLSDLKQLEVKNGIVPIIISCVDNHGCRLLLEEFFEKRETCVYFDSANEYDTGEVVYAYKSNKVVAGPVRSHYFPQIKEGDTRNREEISCEELNNVAPQHIFTNMQAGHLLCVGMANLLSEIVTPGFAYFNAFRYSCDFVAWKGSGENA